MKAVTLPETQAYRAILGRNVSTGVIHNVMGGTSWCGMSRRNYPASLSYVQNAPASLYCEKCFNGKPEAFIEIER